MDDQKRYRPHCQSKRKTDDSEDDEEVLISYVCSAICHLSEGNLPNVRYYCLLSIFIDVTMLTRFV
jgi:hypothetical protein